MKTLMLLYSVVGKVGLTREIGRSQGYEDREQCWKSKFICSYTSESEGSILTCLSSMTVSRLIWDCCVDLIALCCCLCF